jgi:hypothetical protein
MIECARRFGGIVMPPIHLGRTARPGDDGKMLTTAWTCALDGASAPA